MFAMFECKDWQTGSDMSKKKMIASVSVIFLMQAADGMVREMPRMRY